MTYSILQACEAGVEIDGLRMGLNSVERFRLGLFGGSTVSLDTKATRPQDIYVVYIAYGI